MSSDNHMNNSEKEVDEVDAALSDLEITLEGGKTSNALVWHHHHTIMATVGNTFLVTVCITSARAVFHTHYVNVPGCDVSADTTCWLSREQCNKALLLFIGEQCDNGPGCENKGRSHVESIHLCMSVIAAAVVKFIELIRGNTGDITCSTGILKCTKLRSMLFSLILFLLHSNNVFCLPARGTSHPFQS